jgi:hypothetical protein
VGAAVCGIIFPGSDDINRLQGGFLPRRREGVRGMKRRGYFTLYSSLFGDVTRGPPVCVVASGPQQVSASSAGSAVDLMEASSFQSLEVVNGLRPPKAARETRAIDNLNNGITVRRTYLTFYASARK